MERLVINSFVVMLEAAGRRTGERLHSETKPRGTGEDNARGRYGTTGGDE